jgi:hypothetical protein
MKNIAGHGKITIGCKQFFPWYGQKGSVELIRIFTGKRPK